MTEQRLYEQRWDESVLIEKELDFNYGKVEDLTGNLLTLRRQVEMYKDESQRRNHKIFVFKTLFVYLSILIIPALLMKNGRIGQKHGLISIGVISALFFIIIIVSFYNNSSRNNLRYNVHNWDNENAHTSSDSSSSSSSCTSSTGTESKCSMVSLEPISDSDELTAKREELEAAQKAVITAEETRAKLQKQADDLAIINNLNNELANERRETQLKSVFSEIDSNKDSNIGYNEFKKYTLK